MMVGCRQKPLAIGDLLLNLGYGRGTASKVQSALRLQVALQDVAWQWTVT